MNSANEIWMSITPVLQEKYTAIAFTTWFGQVEALDFKMDQLILSCPSDFKAKMIRDRFLSDIEQILHDLFAADIKAVILGPEETAAYRSEAAILGDPEYAFDTRQNNVTSTAFRTYLIGWNRCPVYSIQIDLSL